MGYDPLNNVATCCSVHEHRWSHARWVNNTKSVIPYQYQYPLLFLICRRGWPNRTITMTSSFLSWVGHFISCLTLVSYQLHQSLFCITIPRMSKRITIEIPDDLRFIPKQTLASWVKGDSLKDIVHWMCGTMCTTLWLTSFALACI